MFWQRNSSGTKCNLTCRILSAKAANGMIKKPKVESLPGDTDQTCCESEHCKKWPDVLQEAKDGCNQTNIHDDCLALNCGKNMEGWESRVFLCLCLFVCAFVFCEKANVRKVHR